MLNTTRLDFTQGPDEARIALELARNKMGGSFTCAQAWDAIAKRWAYPDQVLECLGYEVDTFGDTGNYGYALTTCGLLLSSNGFAHAVREPDEFRENAIARGWVAKRLGA